jgi:hypothetical protein
MAKRKPKPKSPFVGRWHIVSMSTWDNDAINEDVQAFIAFEPGGRGSFQFAYVRGLIDYREGSRDGRPCIEFSWDGDDEMDPMTGRGWAAVEGDELRGFLFIHQGDDSDFVAERAQL